MILNVLVYTAPLQIQTFSIFIAGISSSNHWLCWLLYLVYPWVDILNRDVSFIQHTSHLTFSNCDSGYECYVAFTFLFYSTHIICSTYLKWLNGQHVNGRMVYSKLRLDYLLLSINSCRHNDLLMSVACWLNLYFFSVQSLILCRNYNQMHCYF